MLDHTPPNDKLPPHAAPPKPANEKPPTEQTGRGRVFDVISTQSGSAPRDVARAVSVVLEDPRPHIGQIYNLTGFKSADLEHYARVFSKALGRTIRYRDVPLSGWSEKLLAAGVPAHIVKHLSVMTELNKQGHYDRMTDDLFKLTGQKPISMYDFVKLHAAEFTRAGAAT